VVLLNPYLSFNGHCEQAFKFYEKCLKGKIQALIPHEGTPMEQHVPEEWKKKVMHAKLAFGDQILMGSDTPPEHYQKPQGFSVTINLKDPAEAERVFAALSENGKVHMPIGETFWATRFGMLVDQFGIPWMINCEKAA
jgi:PhnB protein